MENINDYHLEQAKKQWQHAITVFNNATTKEDIDYAIFNLEAKKKQYVKLLSTIKKECITNEDFE